MNEATADDLLFLIWLIEEKGYRDLKLIGRYRYACIRSLLFSHRIVTGRIGDRTGIDDAWCYRNYRSAQRALHAWDGQVEPPGWPRHPASGRWVRAPFVAG